MSDLAQYKQAFLDAGRLKDMVHDQKFPILTDTDDGVFIYKGDDSAPTTDDPDLLELQDDVTLVEWASLRDGHRYSPA